MPKISLLFEEPPEALSTAVTQRMAENTPILGGPEKMLLFSPTR